MTALVGIAFVLSVILLAGLLISKEGQNRIPSHSLGAATLMSLEPETLRRWRHRKY